MKKRVMSLLLVMLMVFALLPAAAMATNTPAPKETEGVYLAKSYDPASGMITLEAYTKGEVTVTTTEKAVPCDIVLVLDVSGSMESKLGKTTRIQALKDAVGLFIDKVQENAAANNVNHRVSIVKFADEKTSEVGNDRYYDSYWGEYYNYSQIMNHLTEVTTAEQAAELKADVNSIKEGGATAADYGLEHAKTVFDKVASEEGNADRAKVVVMFTDGEPNHYSGFDEDVANAAVKASKTLKSDSYKAQVYTVGVFNNPSDNVKKYMNAVSSNYPNASKYNDKGISTKISGYFMTASSSDDLNNIFKKIAEQAISGGSLVELDAQSYVMDKMSDYFQLDGVSATDTSKVEIYTANCTGKDTFADPVKKEGLTVSVVDGDTVKVTGYDFSENWVGYNASTGKYGGQKLIIKFPVQPKAGYTGTVPTNKDISGLYDKDDKVALTFPMPDYTPNYVPKIIDFNAEMVLAANVGELGDQTRLNGLFKLNEGVLTYQLLPEEQLGDRSASLVMKGVDSAMTFTSNVWTQYAAIPANNIYFDDALLGTQVAVADGAGYNVGVTTDASEAVTPIKDRDDLVYTFKGTGIDVYCSTNAAGGYVQAGLMTGDSAVPANLVYFESADGHYYKDGDNYVRIDDEHTAPAGAKLYDSSLIAVRNYSITPEGKDRYNVPTVSYTGLPYGTYTVRIKAVDKANYKLDGIRIYNSMDDPDKDSVYAGTDEANAHFYNLREALVNDGQNVTVNTKDETNEMSVYLEGQTAAELPGVLFIDKADSVTLEKTVVDAQGNFVLDENGQPKKELVYKDAFSAYVANGPKNEIYLDKGQGIAFKIDASAQGDKYWIGLSVPDQDSTSAVVAVNGTAVKPTITSAVDMYYEITPRTDGTVVIVNNGDAMVSVTNLKVTSKLPGDKSASPFALMSADALDLAAEATAVESQETPVDQSLKDIFQQLISNFVRILFNNIARMFGK